MPRFSEQSQQRLNECAAELQEVAHVSIAITNFGIITGHRGQKEQQRMYEQGRSQVQFPNSKHNVSPSLAFDFAPWTPELDFLFGGSQCAEIARLYSVSKERAEAFVREQYTLQAGIMLGVGQALGIDLRWGGDWNDDGSVQGNGFDDLGHIELVGEREP